jgi:riboflavin synthase
MLGGKTDFYNMFTGIIEKTGHIREIIDSGTNRRLWIASSISAELKVDQSLSHNGICLTVDEVRDSMHRVTAIKETMDKSTLKSWTIEDSINLERCLALNGRIDGHIVQGHVDCKAICTRRYDQDGSWIFDFTIPAKFSHLIVEKGSISLNGISLTIFDVKKKKFSVAVIPYTMEHTNMGQLKPDMEVNLEFDLIGKYVARLRELDQ